MALDSTIQEDRRFGLDKYSDIKNMILDFAKNDDTINKALERLEQAKKVF